MPALVLGPLLRYVAEREATVWVETDAPCEVEVLGRTARTFSVEGHHYAIVPIEGLEPGRSYEYEVALDGERHWPEPDSEFPPSAISTIDPSATLRIVFGSCRVAVPHEPPYTLSKDKDPRGREIDALYALAMHMKGRPREEWPHLLLSIGDQIYVDEDAPKTRAYIRSRRDTSRPPGLAVLDFEEYTRLYWESWGEPAIAWLFSTVGLATIFDDHDVHDDWNTSIAWLEQMRSQGWWQTRIESALMSYWVYQHLGNQSPRELAENDLLAQVQQAEDGGAILRRWAGRADRGSNGSRWSYKRDIGGVRIIVFDSREGRVLDHPPRRMTDDVEWDRVVKAATGDFDHLLLVDSLPFLLAPAFHHLEAWNEAVCAGAWGKWGKGWGEKLRRALDLEHWAAFNFSFRCLERLLVEVGSGKRGKPPATIIGIGGDVHHAYLSEVGFSRSEGVESAVYQAVCSPFRNPLDRHERITVRAGNSHAMERFTRLLAHTAHVPDPEIRWRLAQKPTFDNQFATLEIEGRRALLRIERTAPAENGDDRTIETSLERRLA
jgi:PhoD-like phosphatase